MENELVPIKVIENKLYIIRNHKAMLDSDLASLYDVETKILNQAVKRNIERFSEDLMFQLNNEEWNFLRSQIVTSNEGKGGRRYNPYVFTEQGVSMLSSVLNSERAIVINIDIMRVFVKIRQIALENKDLSTQLNEL